MASREPFQKVKIGTGWEEEGGSPPESDLLFRGEGVRATSQVICSDMRRQLIIAP
jgi:hypothetical protein